MTTQARNAVVAAPVGAKSLWLRLSGSYAANFA
jgi:hypothetical protein